MKHLAATTDCKLSFSERVPEMKERIFTAEGSAPELLQALKVISRKLQEDPNCPAHANLHYNIKLKLGIWSRGGGDPRCPTLALIHPDDVQGMTKNDILFYLRQAAPSEILIENNLLGRGRNTIKGKSVPDMHRFVADTWEVRGGQGPSRGPVPFLHPLEEGDREPGRVERNDNEEQARGDTSGAKGTAAGDDQDEARADEPSEQGPHLPAGDFQEEACDDPSGGQGCDVSDDQELSHGGKPVHQGSSIRATSDQEEACGDASGDQGLAVPASED